MSETSRLHNLCNGLTGKWHQKKLEAYPRNKEVCSDHVALVAKLLGRNLFPKSMGKIAANRNRTVMVQPYLVYDV